MAKRVQDVRPARKADAQAWVKENVAEQKKRYAAIVKGDGWHREGPREMVRGVPADRVYQALERERDQRMVVAAKDLPKKPKGRSKVVF